MRVTYDPEADALYIRFVEGPAEVLTRRLNDDIALNHTDDGRVVGIEILAPAEYGFQVGEEQAVAIHNLAPAGT